MRPSTSPARELHACPRHTEFVVVIQHWLNLVLERFAATRVTKRQWCQNLERRGVVVLKIGRAISNVVGGILVLLANTDDGGRPVLQRVQDL
jgi:hypothetical protein